MDMYEPGYPKGPQSAYIFDMRGTADVLPSLQNASQSSSMDDLDADAHLADSAVAQLNDIADSIAEEISQQIKQSFPNPIVVQTQLQFRRGSVNWMGVVEVIDWAGRVVNIVDFIGIAIGVIRFASERVIRKTVRQNALPLDPISVQTSVQFRPRPVRPTNDLFQAFAADLTVQQEQQTNLLKGLSRSQNQLVRVIGEMQRTQNRIEQLVVGQRRLNLPGDFSTLFWRSILGVVGLVVLTYVVLYAGAASGYWHIP